MKILFVCLGNICRSPTAHGVLQKKLDNLKIDYVEVDSAGTAAYHIGKAPDERTQEVARTKGYELGLLEARKVTAEDFYIFDYIFAMDSTNYSDLQKIAPGDSTAILEKALSYSSLDFEDVPDPYYGGHDGFKSVLSICEQLSDDIIEQVITKKGEL
jgi:protein-tyrosine phosphatase